MMEDRGTTMLKIYLSGAKNKIHQGTNINDTDGTFLYAHAQENLPVCIYIYNINRFCAYDMNASRTAFESVEMI